VTWTLFNVQQPKLYFVFTDISSLKINNNLQNYFVRNYVDFLHCCGAEEMNELVKEKDNYKIDVCGRQKIKWPGKGTVIKEELYDFKQWWT